MTKDRTYYRCLTNKELVEETKQGLHVDWRELGTVISERLEAEEFNPSNWNACPRCGYED